MRLGLSERVAIEAGIYRRDSLEKIAKDIGISRKSLSKEIRQNRTLSVLGNVINGLSGMIMGLGFGFLSAPTALGYCAGIIGMLAFKTVIPINIQGETIVLAGSVGKNFRERISIVFYSGIIMVVLGGLGLLQRIVDFAGPYIISAMEAGVGVNTGSALG